MNKPLSEWTLGEIKAECEKREEKCRGCSFDINPDECRVMEATRFRCPDSWDLSEPPRWTEDEIEFAKIFQAACKNKIFFERLNDSQILMWGEEGLGSYSNILPYKLLPSLKEGERVAAREIIGGGE